MDKVIIVIGGSGGIGGHTARRLAGDNRVFNCSRTACGIAGVTDALMDVRDAQSCERTINGIAESCNGIDWLVYSAGVSMAAPFEHTTEEDMRGLFEVNYFGFVRCVRLCLPHIRTRGGGRVVGVSSMGGAFPIPYDPFYSASKAAMDVTVRELNIELNPQSIYLTAVAPGGTQTPFSFHRRFYNESAAGEYNGDMLKAASSLVDMEQGGDPADLVARQIVDILYSKHPPLYAPSGVKNKAMAAAKRALPEVAVHQINKKMYGL